MPFSSPLLEPLAPGPTPDALADDLRTTAFAPSVGPRRIGAEVELLPRDAETGRMVPIRAAEGRATLPFLLGWAAAAGWREVPVAGCVPRFHTPEGGLVSFEPGGQIEYSSPPCASVGELVRTLHALVLPLRRAAGEAGIVLEGTGIDPLGGPGEVALQLRSPRYVRMDEYFGRIGEAGARMMRQTAAFQVSLDWEHEPEERWRLLNALSPYLVALFASSPVYAGSPTGARSFRSLTWRTLDPSRTGLVEAERCAAHGYARFALQAPTILLRTPAGDPLPFAEWLTRGATLQDWRVHLSTLFPEVRPRGYAEVRCIDALDAAWYAVPLVILSGLVYDSGSRREAAAWLGEAGPALLHRAGALGLGDPGLRRGATELFQIGLRGARALGEGFVDGGSLEVAEAFFARYTARGLSPADDRAG